GGNIDHSRKLLTSSDVTTHEVLDVRAKVQRRARTVVASLSPLVPWREPTGWSAIGRLCRGPERHSRVSLGILKGENPILEVELIINLRTAKALGITVPLPLLGRADEVIDKTAVRSKTEAKFAAIASLLLVHSNGITRTAGQ